MMDNAERNELVVRIVLELNELVETIDPETEPELAAAAIAATSFAGHLATTTSNTALDLDEILVALTRACETLRATR